jgi:hypothetical protein
MWGGRRDGWRERTIGEYRFSSLVKFKKKRETHTLFYFAGKRFFLYLWCDYMGGKKRLC